MARYTIAWSLLGRHIYTTRGTSRKCGRERRDSIKAALSAGETGREETVAKLDNCVEFELAVRYAHDAFEL